MSVGVKGGLPLTHRFDAQTTDPAGLQGRCAECATQRTVPYTVGLSLEVRLGGPFSLSADALFSRADFNHTTTELFSPSDFFVIDEKHLVDRWEIPIFLKYRIKEWQNVHPFVAAGVSVQHNQDFAQSRVYLISTTGAVIRDTPPGNILGPALGVGDTSVGLGGAAAIGATFGHGRVRPSLEYRFTRWASEPIVVSPRIAPFAGAPRPPYWATPTLHSARNESQFLAGLMFDLGGNGGTSGGGQLRAHDRFMFGVKGGMPLTAAFEAQSIDQNPSVSILGKCGECASQRTVPYVVGPAVEIRLQGGFSLSAEALYSRADYNHTSLVDFSVSSFRTQVEDVKHAVDRWEFPVLLKYTANARHALHPFIAAGVSTQRNRDRELSHTMFTRFDVAPIFLSIEPFPLAADADSTLVGPTLAAGVGFGARRMHPSVEFRFTRWTDQAVVVNPVDSRFILNPLPTVHSNQNQAQFLVGLMF